MLRTSNFAGPIIIGVAGLALILITARPVFLTSDAGQQYLTRRVLKPYLSGTNEALVLQPVIMGYEPDTVTFEVPVQYGRLKSPEHLRLMVDPVGDDPRSGKGGEFQWCQRATNGNCLLVWNTAFDPPGPHRLRAKLYCPGPKKTTHWDILGPPLTFVSTNLLQFDPAYCLMFDVPGALLCGQGPKTNLTYRIEVQTKDGVHMKTINGSTPNGIIAEYWDLRDDHGNLITNDFFQAIFTVLFPDGTSHSTINTRTRAGARPSEP